jgi:hypothetical protein
MSAEMVRPSKRGRLTCCHPQCSRSGQAFDRRITLTVSYGPGTQKANTCASNMTVQCIQTLCKQHDRAMHTNIVRAAFCWILSGQPCQWCKRQHHGRHSTCRDVGGHTRWVTAAESELAYNERHGSHTRWPLRLAPLRACSGDKKSMVWQNDVTACTVVIHGLRKGSPMTRPTAAATRSRRAISVSRGVGTMPTSAGSADRAVVCA